MHLKLQGVIAKNANDNNSSSDIDNNSESKVYINEVSEVIVAVAATKQQQQQ